MAKVGVRCGKSLYEVKSKVFSLAAGFVLKLVM